MLSDPVILVIKGLAGGGLVVTFALLSEGLSPKRFAGLFSAAPAVALAGLTVTLLDKGAHSAHESATGMVADGGRRSRRPAHPALRTDAPRTDDHGPAR